MFKYVSFEVLCSSEILMNFLFILNCVCVSGMLVEQRGDEVKSLCSSHSEKLGEWAFLVFEGVH